MSGTMVLGELERRVLEVQEAIVDFEVQEAMVDFGVQEAMVDFDSSSTTMGDSERS